MRTKRHEECVQGGPWIDYGIQVLACRKDTSPHQERPAIWWRTAQYETGGNCSVSLHLVFEKSLHMY